MLLDVFKLGVGKIGGIAHHGPKRKPSHPSFRIYQTVSLRRWVNKIKKKNRGLVGAPVEKRIPGYRRVAVSCNQPT
jgi:hypothetical protein